MLLRRNKIGYSLNSINQLVFVIEKHSAFLDVGTEFFNVMKMSFGLQRVRGFCVLKYASKVI
jgi:hypothetical protein